MILNILKRVGVKKVMLVGFDGFSMNINDNYFDPSLRRPVTEIQANERNSFFRHFISELRDFMVVQFITPSLYE